MGNDFQDFQDFQDFAFRKIYVMCSIDHVCKTFFLSASLLLLSLLFLLRKLSVDKSQCAFAAFVICEKHHVHTKPQISTRA